VFTRESGIKIIGTARVWNATAMVTDMKVSFKTINLMVKEFTPGQMVKFTKVNGAKD